MVCDAEGDFALGDVNGGRGRGLVSPIEHEAGGASEQQTSESGMESKRADAARRGHACERITQPEDAEATRGDTPGYDSFRTTLYHRDANYGSVVKRSQLATSGDGRQLSRAVSLLSQDPRKVAYASRPVGPLLVLSFRRLTRRALQM